MKTAMVFITFTMRTVEIALLGCIVMSAYVLVKYCV